MEQGRVSTDHTRELLAALMGTECVCGQTKQPKMSHCRNCYFALPPAMRKALYRHMRDGYEQAFDESVAELRTLGRVK